MLVHRTVFIVSIANSSLVMAQLEVGPLPTSVWCAGSSFDVPFTATGSFDPGNSFIVELSDASGVFAPGTPIGSFASDVSGTVTCSSWGIAAPGAGYLVRVRSTSPAYTSAAGSSTLTLASPNAGMDGFATICASGPPLMLISVLGGSPQSGGTWSDPNATGALDGAILQPGQVEGGTYTFTYTVNAAGCTDEATVTMVLNLAPNAGTNAAVTVCSTDPPFTMYQELGGSPGAGGAWTSPAGAQMNGVFDPSMDPAGIYTYTVVGDPPCSNEAATLVITVNQAPNAGTDGSASYCVTDPAFPLLQHLGGSPSPAGTWIFNSMPHGPIFDPGTDGPGEYVYTVLGTSPCGTATATVTVSQVACLVNTPVNLGIPNVTE
jgi:hypothetical protein